MTWNRQISRLIYRHCASCHHEGGSSFSLMDFPEARDRAAAIKLAVLSRRMPPWGAVQGFGEFRGDEGLTESQIEMFVDWADTGTARGNNPRALPDKPTFTDAAPFKPPRGSVVATGDLTLRRPMRLAGVLADEVPEGASARIVAELPDGRIEPLVWLYEYKKEYRHPFYLRAELALPQGTVIRGLPQGSRVTLLAPK